MAHACRHNTGTAINSTVLGIMYIFVYPGIYMRRVWALRRRSSNFPNTFSFQRYLSGIVQHCHCFGGPLPENFPFDPFAAPNSRILISSNFPSNGFPVVQASTEVVKYSSNMHALRPGCWWPNLRDCAIFLFDRPNAAEQVAAARALPGQLLPQRHDGGAGARHCRGFLVGPSDAAYFCPQDPVGFGRRHHLEGCGQCPQGGGYLLHGYILSCHGESFVGRIIAGKRQAFLGVLSWCSAVCQLGYRGFCRKSFLPAGCGMIIVWCLCLWGERS